MKRLRTFIAATPPKESLQKIAKIQEKVKEKNLPIRWEDPQKLHITIMFLGHITQARMETAAKAVEKTAKEVELFEIEINGLSYFYKKSGDSIIYLDIPDKEKKFKNLYKMLFNNLVEERFYPPTRFNPHITLGRVKRQRHPHQTKRILTETVETDVLSVGTFFVNELQVYESIYSKTSSAYEHTANNQRYHLLKSFPLKT